MLVSKKIFNAAPFLLLLFLPFITNAATTVIDTVDTSTDPIVVHGTSTEAGGTITNVEYQVNSTSGSWSNCSATDGTFNASSESFDCSLGSVVDGSYTVYVRTIAESPIPFSATTTDPSVGNDRGYDIASDSSNLYFAGSCVSCGTNGGTAIYTVAVSKADGSFVWSTTTDPTSGSDNANGIVVDSNNVYVTGICTNCGSMGGSAYYTLAMLKSDGSFVWATTSDLSAVTDTADDITVDENNVYVTGYCNGCGALGNYAHHTIAYSKADGSYVWSTTTDPTSGFDSTSGITVDASNVYISGDCNGCGAAGGYAFYTQALSKTDGSFVWSTTTDPTSGGDNTYDITSDSNNIYITGTCDGCGNQGGSAFYTQALSKTDGSFVWSTTTDPTADFDYAYGIDVDSNNVYVTGYCDACDTNGSDAIYTVAYDNTDGSMVWSTSTDPSSSYDNGWGITHDDEYVYVNGYCNGCGSGGTIYTIAYAISDGRITDTGTTTSNTVFTISAPAASPSSGGTRTKSSVSSVEVVTTETSTVDTTTTESLQVIIKDLEAQVDALVKLAESLGYDVTTVTTETTSYVFTVDLGLGSTHPDVVYLQQYLVAKGYLVMPVGVSYGYYGPLTQAAVAALQIDNGIEPAAGYFGPLTRSFVNANQ